MPPARSSPRRLIQGKASPPKNTRPRTQHRTRSQNRTVDISEREDEPADHIGASGPINDGLGLDWSWVEALDQDPTKDYFPLRFTPHVSRLFTGDDHEQPKIKEDTDMPDYTAWVLARVRKMLVSKAVSCMVSDPSLEVKWTLSLNSHIYDRSQRYRELKLMQYQSPASNHEAAYAAMVGIVLPPERACTNCKARQGPFRHCIVVPNYLHGACAGCHYNSGGSKCSHRSNVPRRTKSAGASKAAPILSSIYTGDEQTVQQQHTSGITSKAIKDFKAQLLIMMDQIEQLERQGLVVVS